MIDFFVSDPKFTISLVLAIVSLIMAFIFYFRSLNLKKPCYSGTNTLLVTPSLLILNPIKVLFQDKPIDTLSITHIAFWNDGKATINGTDIVKSDRLRIATKNKVRILAAEIVGTNKPANNIKLVYSQQYHRQLLARNRL